MLPFTSKAVDSTYYNLLSEEFTIRLYKVCMYFIIISARLNSTALITIAVVSNFLDHVLEHMIHSFKLTLFFQHNANMSILTPSCLKLCRHISHSPNYVLL